VATLLGLSARSATQPPSLEKPTHLRVGAAKPIFQAVRSITTGTRPLTLRELVWGHSRGEARGLHQSVPVSEPDLITAPARRAMAQAFILRLDPLHGARADPGEGPPSGSD